MNFRDDFKKMLEFVPIKVTPPTSDCPFLLCRCDEYKEIAKNFEYFHFAAIYPEFYEKRIEVPKGLKFTWIKGQLNYLNLNVFTPCLEGVEEKVKVKEELPAKWIPVSGDLISLRLVNQCKKPNSLIG